MIDQDLFQQKKEHIAEIKTLHNLLELCREVLKALESSHVTQYRLLKVLLYPVLQRTITSMIPLQKKIILRNFFSKKDENNIIFHKKNLKKNFLEEFDLSYFSKIFDVIAEWLIVLNLIAGRKWLRDEMILGLKDRCLEVLSCQKSIEKYKS